MGVSYEDYLSALSLFSGAGGLDVGVDRAGFRLLWANDFDKDSCKTYSDNVGSHIRYGDIRNYLPEIASLKGSINLLVGGPPCQGISGAGRQNINDPRTQHLWTYMDVLKVLLPDAFIIENVSALVSSPLFSPLLVRLIERARSLRYSVGFIVLNASEYGAPQRRRRVFIIGFRGDSSKVPDLAAMMRPYRSQAISVRESLSSLDVFKTGNNATVMGAKIILMTNPVVGDTPETSRLFNGYGLVLNLDGYSGTITAYGGNGLPIINMDESRNSWLSWFFKELRKGGRFPGGIEAHSSLRRITAEEAAKIQTFPPDFTFFGSASSRIKQIGNAVPCELSYRVSRMVYDYLRSGKILVKK